ncbi:MAG: FKBP-type peptidyl-prolyl cis-trans isomerase [Bacteroidota bacterium]
MEIAEDRVVTITYEVRKDGPQGPLLERMDVNYPFKALFGRGKLLPAWEKQLVGLSPGDSFRFLLRPQEAYGEPTPDSILSIPLQVFSNAEGESEAGLLEKDQYITLTDSNGKAVNGKIIDWDDKQVRVDCNHALAGFSLFFVGTVLNVREATVDELVKGGLSPE